MTLPRLTNLKLKKSFGFTLIELLVVIIMISIMAVTVLPKFFSSNGFEEYTYRDELITKLRAIQLRSMQQTSGTTCLNVQLASSPSVIALQATQINTITGLPDGCKIGHEGDTTTITVDPKHNVNFSISEGLTSFNFSNFGRPEGCLTTNPCRIEITIEGESTVKIEINTEGYIHAM